MALPTKRKSNRAPAGDGDTGALASPPSSTKRPAPHQQPSDICIVLSAFPAPNPDRFRRVDGWLSAEEIRDRLARLGFDCSTQQVAAWLKRISKLDAPPIDVETSPYGNGYRASHFGETWIHNVLPDIWWAQQRGRERAERRGW